MLYVSSPYLLTFVAPVCHERYVFPFLLASRSAPAATPLLLPPYPNHPSSSPARPLFALGRASSVSTFELCPPFICHLAASNPMSSALKQYTACSHLQRHSAHTSCGIVLPRHHCNFFPASQSPVSVPIVTMSASDPSSPNTCDPAFPVYVLACNFPPPRPSSTQHVLPRSTRLTTNIFPVHRHSPIHIRQPRTPFHVPPWYTVKGGRCSTKNAIHSTFTVEIYNLHENNYPNNNIIYSFHLTECLNGERSGRFTMPSRGAFNPPNIVIVVILPVFPPRKLSVLSTVECSTGVGDRSGMSR